jgi:hypothetical protein
MRVHPRQLRRAARTRNIFLSPVVALAIHGAKKSIGRSMRRAPGIIRFSRMRLPAPIAHRIARGNNRAGVSDLRAIVASRAQPSPRLQWRCDLSATDRN